MIHGFPSAFVAASADAEAFAEEKRALNQQLILLFETSRASLMPISTDLRRWSSSIYSFRAQS